MSKPLTLLLAFLLIVLSLAAAAVGMADIYRREAAMLIGEWDWSDNTEGTPAWAWEQIQRYLWLASRLAPFDAQVLGDLGQLYELRGEGALAPGSSANLERALGYYRQALTLRPAWPYAWSNIAALKISQQRIDAEFALAMHSALTLGPWQPVVQASIAGGGLVVWDKLPASLQTHIEDTVARGLSSGSRLMRAVAGRFKLLESGKDNPAPVPSSHPAPEG
jgi:tetratricopeptide (TPR) repeat protein